MTGMSRLLAVISLIWLGSFGSATAQTIEGRFCGRLMSQYGLVDHYTELVLRPDGHLAGFYILGGALGGLGGRQGRLVETETGSERVRHLAWSDRRGSGKLVITFNETMTAFRGFWAMGAAEPKARWDGERCAGL